MSSDWKQLKPFPFKYFDKPLLLNDNEFIIVPQSYTGFRSDGIYKYNIDVNQWIKILRYPPDFTSSYHSICLDKENQLIYVCNVEDKILTFDLNAKKQTQQELHLNVGSHPKCIYINNMVHSIGGSGNNKHYIYNPKTKEIKQKYEFHDFKNISLHYLVHLKNKKTLLLFGGKRRSDVFRIPSDFVYELCLSNNKWTKWHNKCPQKLSGFAAIPTYDDKKIIIFGGQNGKDYNLDDIFIYNIETNKIKKSSIKCPVKGLCHVVKTYGRTDGELLTFAFVNSCWKTKQFENLIRNPLPTHLIKLIANWLYDEFVHLIGFGSGQHWRISLNDILS
eukprot:518858_1